MGGRLGKIMSRFLGHTDEPAGPDQTNIDAASASGTQAGPRHRIDVVPTGTPGRAGMNGKWAVIAGELDGNFERGYMFGYCRDLAAAMSDITGWPVWTVETIIAGKPHPGHWGVMAPDGKFVDATGAHYPEDIEPFNPAYEDRFRPWGDHESDAPPPPERLRSP
jgi:hypothetical protein